MWIVMLGNPIDGMEVVGPFTDVEKANDWGETYGEGWLAVPVMNPVAKLEDPNLTMEEAANA